MHQAHRLGHMCLGLHLRPHQRSVTSNGRLRQGRTRRRRWWWWRRCYRRRWRYHRCRRLRRLGHQRLGRWRMVYHRMRYGMRHWPGNRLGHGLGHRFWVHHRLWRWRQRFRLGRLHHMNGDALRLGRRRWALLAAPPNEARQKSKLQQSPNQQRATKIASRLGGQGIGGERSTHLRKPLLPNRCRWRQPSGRHP
jgi:hypothetical protein